ncbi:acetyltransferase [Georgenia sp. TF02-10]|uniref:acetyltransferase n=1 Tax=Georgenia sp. TF02-10 TaxID=2917725 RepID=UPI001FA6AE59|nr:acetyltransferase [Georgenia sp. TF02-10]UNX55379.1 acetyltransferase [Georgenia sp. TF02-10]
MPERLVTVGAGGFGREVLDVVNAACSSGDSIDFLGVLDDSPSERDLSRLASLGARYLGTTQKPPDSINGARFAIGIADPVVRSTIHERLSRQGLRPMTLVHPSATIGQDVYIADGTIICAGARLTTNIRLGAHTHVHINAAVGHDTTLGAFSSVYPQGAVSGRCVIAEGVTIGANATVLQGRRVGERAFIGAGSVVTHNIPAGQVAYGVPARIAHHVPKLGHES